MSELYILDLCDMELKQYSVDDSNNQIDKLTFVFNLTKKDLRKKWKEENDKIVAL